MRPLVVSVSLAEETVLADWRRGRHAHLPAGAGLLFVVLALAGFLARHFRLCEQAKQPCARAKPLPLLVDNPGDTSPVGFDACGATSSPASLFVLGTGTPSSFSAPSRSVWRIRTIARPWRRYSRHAGGQENAGTWSPEHRVRQTAIAGSIRATASSATRRSSVRRDHLDTRDIIQGNEGGARLLDAIIASMTVSSCGTECALITYATPATAYVRPERRVPRRGDAADKTIECVP